MNLMQIVLIEIFFLLVIIIWILRLVMDEPIINIGTKSILFGAHCFFIHPIFVAIAWTKLYGFPKDRKIWLAFFVHDLGYWGKPNIDGIEGETHPELGAKIMGYFGKEWHDFSLYHSRYYAKRNNAKYSKLCVADKLAFCIEPYWFYIFRVTLSGEIKEFMSVHHFRPGQTKKEWYKYVVRYMFKWVAIHRDLRTDNETICLQKCESCEKEFDIDTMIMDFDSNWFCTECWTELAPVMKSEYQETLENEDELVKYCHI